jgi:tetratricopeptide (TPR) repeat protein
MTSPEIVSQYEDLYLGKRASDVSYCRWTLDKTNQSFSNTAEYRKAVMELKNDFESSSVNETSNEPLHWNYLTLRQVQNTNWAEDRLRKGNELVQSAWNSDLPDIHISSNLLRKAEECYKEGLEMIQHHSGLLRSYGVLCYRESRFEQAYDLLKRALSDATMEESNEIHMLLSSIGKKLGLASRAAELLTHTSANMTLSGRAENALKDAMAEKDLAYSSYVPNIPSMEDMIQSVEHKISSSASSSPSSSSNQSSQSRRRKKRSKRKHHKHHKSSKRHKRKRDRKDKRRKGSRDDGSRTKDDYGS